MPGTAREPSLLVDEDYRITLVTKDYGQPGDLSQSKVAGNQMSGVVQGVCHNKMVFEWRREYQGPSKDWRVSKDCRQLQPSGGNRSCPWAEGRRCNDECSLFFFRLHFTSS
jgi:hypothetical protein